jgi:hypothetical protein
MAVAAVVATSRAADKPKELPKAARRLLARIANTRWQVAALTKTPVNSFQLYSYDSSRVKRLDGSNYVVWIRRDYSEPVEPTRLFNRAIMKIELDCQEMRFKLESTQFYLNDTPGNGGPGDGSWEDMLPDSNDEKAYSRICDTLNGQ